MLNALEQLEQAATPGPWQVEKPSRGRLYGIGRHMAPEITPRCISKGADAWLIVEARNALPKLLRLARAVANEKAAALEMDKAIMDSAYLVAQMHYNRAVLATAAALADLESNAPETG